MKTEKGKKKVVRPQNIVITGVQIFRCIHTRIIFMKSEIN